MGFDPDLFLDRIYPYMVCKLCTLVADEPMVTSCKHIFCLQCIQSWLAREGNTPNVKETRDGIIKQCPVTNCFRWLSIKSLKKAINLRSVVHKLQLYCPYKSLGCHEVLLVEAIKTHLQSCKYRYKLYQEDKRQSRQLDDHLESSNDKAKIRIHHSQEQRQSHRRQHHHRHRHSQQQHDINHDERSHRHPSYAVRRSRSSGDKTIADLQYLYHLAAQDNHAMDDDIIDPRTHSYLTSLVSFNKQQQVDFKLLRQKVAEQQIKIWSQENQITTLNDTMKLLKQGLIYRPPMQVNDDQGIDTLRQMYSPTVSLISHNVMANFIS